MSQSPVVVVSEGMSDDPISCRRSTLSSDAFCLFYDAQTKTVRGLNGSGRSPAKLTLEYIRQRGVSGGQIPLTDLNAVTVPGTIYVLVSSCYPNKTWIGAAAAWIDTVEQFGSQKVSVADVLAPAISLAEEGYTYLFGLSSYLPYGLFHLESRSQKSTAPLYDRVSYKHIVNANVFCIVAEL